MKEAMIMGKVALTEFVRIAGLYESAENIFEYFYCDKCGSFDLESHTEPYTKKMIGARIALAISIGAFAAVGGIFTHNWIVSCVIGGFGWIAFLIIAPKPGGFIRCRKCGNEHISNINILNYPDDISILDVSVSSATRIFIKAQFNS
jgi:hypothetical protein